MKSNFIKLANIILIFLFILGILISVSTRWVSTSDPSWGNLILMLSGLFSIGILGIFWLKDDIKLNVCMLLFSCLLSLAIADKFIIYREHSIVEGLARIAKIDYDSRGILNVIKDLEKDGKEPYLFPTPYRFFQYTWNRVPLNSFFPLGGKSKATTVFCNENGTWANYKSDRYGYNNNDSVFDLESPAIILIGDSFVHGSCVPQEKTIAGSLREKGFKAISLGIGGQGPLLELASLVEYGQFLKPKAIVWFYFNQNDMIELNIEALYPILLKYLENDFSQNLIKRQGFIDSFWRKFNEQRIFDAKVIKVKNLLTFSRVRNKLKLAVNSSLKITSLKTEAVNSNNQRILLEQVLKKAKLLTEKAGGTFYLVNLDALVSTSNKNKNTTSTENYNKLNLLAKKLQIPIINMNLESIDNPTELFSLNTIGNHFNEKGYRLVADLIIKKGWIGGFNLD